MLRLLVILWCSTAAAQTVEGLFVEIAPGVVVEFSDLGETDAAMATPLHRAAAATQDAELIRRMLELGADPRARDIRGRTPLHAAAEAGAPLGVMAALLGGGADVRARDAEGRTALGLAATAEGAALLAVAGGDACATDARGAPALGETMLERIRVEAPSLYPQARAAYLACL